MSSALTKESEARKQPIDILTDARHGTRKNSRQTDVICIGNKTKKVVAFKTVTSEDDRVAQRHEKLGTVSIYNSLKAQSITIAKHCHDNNASISKYVREEHPETLNQLDNWHGLKQLEKSLQNISKGPKRDHGRTWHNELDDKPHAIRVHAQFCLKNCNGSAENFRTAFVNCVKHYQGDHTNCPYISRCKTDTAAGRFYNPTKKPVFSERAVQLLTDALEKSHMYKNAHLYVEDMSTAHVETFNTTLNVLHDKRISFSHQTYKAKTALAVGFWNEGKEKFCDTVWDHFVD